MRHRDCGEARHAVGFRSVLFLRPEPPNRDAGRVVVEPVALNRPLIHSQYSVRYSRGASWARLRLFLSTQRLELVEQWIMSPPHSWRPDK
jgi:hypothetical protein